MASLLLPAFLVLPALLLLLLLLLLQFTNVQSLPAVWSTLTKLQNLTLSNVNVPTGATVPPGWSRLTNLQTLQLDNINVRGRS